ncbi:unnamed protein product [Rotaria magnacalcarata]|nr:unnamed protein product [Rotaria magnacalcarata]
MDGTTVDGAENVVTSSEIRTSPGSVLHSFMESTSMVTAINISNASMNFTTHAASSSRESTVGRRIPVTSSSSSEYSMSFGETATRFSSEYVNGMNEQLTVVNSQDQTSISTISPRAETNTNQITVDNSFLTDAPNNGAVFVTSITPTTRSEMQSSLLTYSDSVSNIRTITPTSTNAMNIITSVEQVSEDRSSSTFNMKYTIAELTEIAINFGDESAVPDSDTTHSKMTDTTTNQDSSTNAPVTITSTIASVEYSSSEQITSFTSMLIVVTVSNIYSENSKILGETMVSSRTTISDSAAYVQNESSSSTSAITSSSMDTTDHTTFLSDTDSLTTESFKSTDTTLSTSQNQLQSTAEEYKSEETTSSTISSILSTDAVTMSSAIEVTTRSNTIPSSVSEQSITDRTTLDSSTYLYSSTQKVIDETSTSTMSIMNTDQSSILASTISPSNVTATVEMMSSIDVELSSSQISVLSSQSDSFSAASDGTTSDLLKTTESISNSIQSTAETSTNSTLITNPTTINEFTQSSTIPTTSDLTTQYSSSTIETTTYAQSPTMSVLFKEGDTTMISVTSINIISQSTDNLTPLVSQSGVYTDTTTSTIADPTLSSVFSTFIDGVSTATHPIVESSHSNAATETTSLLNLDQSTLSSEYTTSLESTQTSQGKVDVYTDTSGELTISISSYSRNAIGDLTTSENLSTVTKDQLSTLETLSSANNDETTLSSYLNQQTNLDSTTENINTTISTDSSGEISTSELLTTNIISQTESNLSAVETSTLHDIIISSSNSLVETTSSIDSTLSSLDLTNTVSFGVTEVNNSLSTSNQQLSSEQQQNIETLSTTQNLDLKTSNPGQTVSLIFTQMPTIDQTLTSSFTSEKVNEQYISSILPHTASDATGQMSTVQLTSLSNEPVFTTVNVDTTLDSQGTNLSSVATNAISSNDYISSSDSSTFSDNTITTTNTQRTNESTEFTTTLSSPSSYTTIENVITTESSSFIPSTIVNDESTTKNINESFSSIQSTLNLFNQTVDSSTIETSTEYLNATLVSP